jgi:uncharacterized protein Yka (UPF0111/DUF47 family)
MLKIFKKRRNVFIHLLYEQASLTLEGMDILIVYLSKPDQAPADQLKQKEKEADEARRILIDQLNHTFITPFDREDIFALSRAVDDVIDYAYSTMSEIVVLKVDPTDYMVRIATLLRDGAVELRAAIKCLQDHPKVAAEHAQRAKAIENKVEKIYRDALADMFKDINDVKKVVKVLKLREIYRHLSNAADRGDEAANVIADIVVKSA